MTTTTTLTRTATDSFLRTVLRLDAIASGAIGVLFLAAAGALQDHLGTPTALTRGTGALLVAFAVFVWNVSTRTTGGLVGLVIGLNLFWVVDSVVYAVADDGLTALGVAFTLVQAAAVLGFAALEYVGLRKARRVVR
jgi:hypothetical protein